ncbi:hypothetical protein C446_10170 [Halobiforma nitratireducens JCM 10879]|uniref:YdbS-like PH domain-containing protein n=1 Tax=Halobiforma nitratireducens JCM 10879 TaxID=1227454 RepID=M0LX96_9EURY|nr:hypothetical protein C446_10170 [Halobiforma nitratireducens JCM 10879]
MELPLLEDEEVIVDTRPTWWAWAVHLAIAGLFALLGVAIATQDLAVGFFVLVLAAAVGGYAWYRRNRVRYLVTDRRIVVIAGFSTKTTSETWVEDVRGLRTKTTAFSRNQGYGTISVSHAISSGSFGWGNGLRLRGVPEFESVAAAIRRQQSRRK